MYRIVKDAIHMKELVRGTAIMKLMILTKKHEGEVSEMEKAISDVGGSSYRNVWYWKDMIGGGGGQIGPT
jgi:hypothetical protein